MNIISLNSFINQTRPYLTMDVEIITICARVADEMIQSTESFTSNLQKAIWIESSLAIKRELEFELSLRN